MAKVAVLTLTRDRLDYTKHCFAQLKRFAGCEYDHYVLDQGSQDGTQEWLRNEYAPKWIELLQENLGVSKGINRLLDAARDGKYDWYVKFDNDCELLVQNTLKDALVDDAWCLSPHIQGLDSPPAIEQIQYPKGITVGVTNILGGIFMPMPRFIAERYRHDESNPLWGMDDARYIEWFKREGGACGYMLDYPANHYLTTAGQRADNVGGYYDRKVAEFHA